MTLGKKSLAALIAAPFLVAGLIACGEEGQSMGEGQCPVLPLYKWLYTDAGGWRRVTQNGTPPDPNVLDRATQDLPTNGRCQTPAGVATTIGLGAAGAPSGTGGAQNKDAGKD